MTELSPAAQAVWDAAWANCPVQFGDIEGTRRAQVAAALRAATDQVVPETSKPDDTFCCPPVETIVWNKLMHVRQQLLALAAELEGAQ